MDEQVDRVIIDGIPQRGDRLPEGVPTTVIGDFDGVGVTTFDSAEEMLAWIEGKTAEAVARSSAEQQAITYGDCFMRPWGVGPEAFVIFGRIPSWEEFKQAEHGSDEAEWEWIRDHRLAADRDGYRFSWCFSVVVPEGEPGDTHVSTMTKISRVAFEQARNRDWDFLRCVADGLPWALAVME